MKVCGFVRETAESADSTDQHSLSNAHLEGRDPKVTCNEDNDRNERDKGLERGRREVVLSLELGLVNLSVRITLVVAHKEGNDQDTNDEDGTAHQGEGHMEADGSP